LGLLLWFAQNACVNLIITNDADDLSFIRHMLDDLRHWRKSSQTLRYAWAAIVLAKPGYLTEHYCGHADRETGNEF